MGTKCLKCGYERLPTDFSPEHECPKCADLYSKVEAKTQGTFKQDMPISDEDKIKAIKARAAFEKKQRKEAEELKAWQEKQKTVIAPADKKLVEIVLAIGIFLFPLIFAWLTLREGYSKRAKAVSFCWLVLIIVISIVIVGISTKIFLIMLFMPSFLMLIMVIAVVNNAASTESFAGILLQIIMLFAFFPLVLYFFYRILGEKEPLPTKASLKQASKNRQRKEHLKPDVTPRPRQARKFS